MLIILGFVQACYYIFIDPKSVCNTYVYRFVFSCCKEFVAWFTAHGLNRKKSSIFVSVEENGHYFKNVQSFFSAIVGWFFLPFNQRTLGHRQ